VPSGIAIGMNGQATKRCACRWIASSSVAWDGGYTAPLRTWHAAGMSAELVLAQRAATQRAVRTPRPGPRDRWP
jgi:hypothetical protein